MFSERKKSDVIPRLDVSTEMSLTYKQISSKRNDQLWNGVNNEIKYQLGINNSSQHVSLYLPKGVIKLEDTGMTFKVLDGNVQLTFEWQVFTWVMTSTRSLTWQLFGQAKQI